MATLGVKLKTLRLGRDLTQEDVATSLGVARATIASWETDRREPDNNALRQLAMFFGVSVDYLLDREDTQFNTAAAKVAAALAQDPELYAFWDEISQRDDLQLMFKQVRDFPPESIRKIIRIIKAIEDEEA